MRRELQVEPLVLCLVQPAPSGTPAYKPRVIEDHNSKKNKYHNNQGNKNQNSSNKKKDEINKNDSNKEDVVTGRTRRRRSALTTNY